MKQNFKYSSLQTGVSECHSAFPSCSHTCSPWFCVHTHTHVQSIAGQQKQLQEIEVVATSLKRILKEYYI